MYLLASCPYGPTAAVLVELVGVELVDVDGAVLVGDVLVGVVLEGVVFEGVVFEEVLVDGAVLAEAAAGSEEGAVVEVLFMAADTWFDANVPSGE